MIDIKNRPGLVATICLSGTVTPEYAINLSNMRDYNTRAGLTNVEYKIFSAVLVEAGRDAAATHALENDYEWILQIDADAAPFAANSLEKMLVTIFDENPGIDVLGGYCQIKGHPHLPTIDTGTGTWEEHYPGEGVLPVIRTGAHFFLSKCSVFRRFGPPWFRTRIPTTPLRAMMELDNFARTHLAGNNPLTEHPEWMTLFQHAREMPVGDGLTQVGEDSGFFDRLRATGGRAAVDTSIVVGHVASKTIMPVDFVDAVQEARKRERAALGVREWP